MKGIARARDGATRAEELLFGWDFVSLGESRREARDQTLLAERALELGAREEPEEVCAIRRWAPIPGKASHAELGPETPLEPSRPSHRGVLDLQAELS